MISIATFLMTTGAVVVGHRMVVVFRLQLTVQSVSITTKVVSSNPANGDTIM